MSKQKESNTLSEKQVLKALQYTKDKSALSKEDCEEAEKYLAEKVDLETVITALSLPLDNVQDIITNQSKSIDLMYTGFNMLLDKADVKDTSKFWDEVKTETENAWKAREERILEEFKKSQQKEDK